MAVFFTADTHYGHRNILRHCNRPFPSSEEMDAAMIAKWQVTVTDDDEVYHLGDYAWSMGRGRLRWIFDSLPGRKHLVIGNHDRADVLALPWASPPTHYRRIQVGGRTVVLSHYGLRVWEVMHHGSLHLYGHSHGSLPGYRTAWGGGCCDVGVDCWRFEPISLDRIVERMDTFSVHLPETAAEV